MKALKLTTVLALILLAGVAVHAKETKPPVVAPLAATMTEHVRLTPTEMKWSDAPPSVPPGAKMTVVQGDPTKPNELFTFRLKLPANYKIMPHFHPADEHITVISGAFWMGMGGKYDAAQMKELPAGSFAVMPLGHQHFAMTKVETVVQVHAVGPWGITYVNPADDPRNASPTR
jgi:quercetin dioxygenase-like cupin family protein